MFRIAATQNIGSNVTQDQIELAVSSVLAKFGSGAAVAPPN